MLAPVHEGVVRGEGEGGRAEGVDVRAHPVVRLLRDQPGSFHLLVLPLVELLWVKVVLPLSLHLDPYSFITSTLNANVKGGETMANNGLLILMTIIIIDGSTFDREIGPRGLLRHRLFSTLALTQVKSKAEETFFGYCILITP